MKVRRPGVATFVKAKDVSRNQLRHRVYTLLCGDLGRYAW